MKPGNPIIALAQIKYFDECKNNNVGKIKKYIKLAKRAKADIVCFPETCVHKTEFLDKNDWLLREIRDECRENKIWCIITEHLRIKKRDYNTAILIDREGKTRGMYKKIHLYGDEVKPGKKTRVFETDFAKIGIAICWDLSFPELFRKMRKAGAQIVFCPAKWWYETKAHDKAHKKREIKILESLIRTRAFENLFYVAICNPVMDSKYQISYSAIASPHRLIKEIVEKEGLITAKINLKELERLKKLYES